MAFDNKFTHIRVGENIGLVFEYGFKHLFTNDIGVKTLAEHFFIGVEITSLSRATVTRLTVATTPGQSTETPILSSRCSSIMVSIIVTTANFVAL